MKDVHTSKFWLTGKRLEVYDSKLATRINKKLLTYDNGRYRFKVGEEALFSVSLENAAVVYKLLGL